MKRGQAPEAAAKRVLDELVDPTRPLLLAVSGGGDSMAMVLAFHRALSADRSNPPLFAATVDHRLRAESEFEAEAVGKFCATLGIPHRVLPWTEAKPGTGIQAAARLARYRILAAEAERRAAGAVLTAHTLDDQFETVRMRARRHGDDTVFGSAGMAQQMLFDRKMWVLRPFLDCRRADLRHYLKTNGVDWIEDPSNSDPRFERVRQRYSAEVDAVEADRLASNIDRAASDRLQRSEVLARVLHAYASQWRRALFTMRDDGSVPNELLADAVAELIGVAGGQTYPLAGAQIAKLRMFLKDAKPGRRLSLGRCIVMRRSGVVLVWREDRGFEDRIVKAHGSARWDDRFLIENRSDEAIVVTRYSAAETAKIADIPDAATHAVALAALSTLPAIRPLSEASDSADMRATEKMPTEAKPVIARYDTFLPVFEWKLGSALARLLAVAPYAAAPLGGVNLDRTMRQ